MLPIKEIFPQRAHDCQGNAAFYEHPLSITVKLRAPVQSTQKVFASHWSMLYTPINFEINLS